MKKLLSTMLITAMMLTVIPYLGGDLYSHAATKYMKNVKATALDEAAIRISWERTSGVKGFVVYRNGKKIGESTKRSFTDIGLRPLTKYTYVIKGYTKKRTIKKTQYYNSKKKKWQSKKPSAKQWKGKKKRVKKTVKYTFSNKRSKAVSATTTAVASYPSLSYVRAWALPILNADVLEKTGTHKYHPPLKENEVLDKLAQERAEYMAANRTTGSREDDEVMKPHYDTVLEDMNLIDSYYNKEPKWAISDSFKAKGITPGQTKSILAESRKYLDGAGAGLNNGCYVFTDVGIGYSRGYMFVIFTGVPEDEYIPE